MSSDPDTPATTAFTGFDIPRQNWFKMPNNWTDITAEISSIAELKVVEYVLKHTWGYQEYGMRKRITNDEFMHGRRRKDGTRIDKGTGLSKPSVIAGLKAAVERGLLIEEIDDSDKARVKKYYSLRMMPGLNDEFMKEGDEPFGSPDPGMDGGGVKDLNAGVKNLYPEVKNLYPRGKRSLPRTEQDTLARHLQEETNINNNSGVNPTKSDVVVALSSQEIAEEEQANHPASTTSVPLDPTPLDPPAPSAADGKAETSAALLGMGLAETVTERLVSRYSVERIKEKIEFLTYIQEQTPERVKNPRGWLRRAIEENYGPPDGFLSQAEREQLAQETAQQVQIAAEQAKVTEEFARIRQSEIEAQQGAFRQTLQAQYGTTDEDYTFWEEVKQEISYLARPDIFELIEDAHLLQRTKEAALIGVVHDHHLRRLSHPNTQTAIKRACTRIAGATIEPTFVLVPQ